MFKKLGVMAVVFAALSGSRAEAFLIEPYAGYHFGTLKDDSLNISDSFNGFGFGARAGMTFTSMLFAGLDFQYAPVTADTDTGDEDYNYMSLGLVAGVNISSFRAWGGLNFINKFTHEDGDSAKGMGFKIGVGYKFVPLVSLNVEYLINPLTEFCPDGGSCRDTEDNSANSVFVSLSVPLSI